MIIGTKCPECKGIGSWVGAGHITKKCKDCSGSGIIQPKLYVDMQEMLGLKRVGFELVEEEKSKEDVVRETNEFIREEFMNESIIDSSTKRSDKRGR